MNLRVCCHYLPCPSMEQQRGGESWASLVGSRMHMDGAEVGLLSSISWTKLPDCGGNGGTSQCEIQIGRLIRPIRLLSKGNCASGTTEL